MLLLFNICTKCSLYNLFNYKEIILATVFNIFFSVRKGKYFEFMNYVNPISTEIEMYFKIKKEQFTLDVVRK